MQMTNTHKIARLGAGLYYFTGHIAGRLVQYSIVKSQAEWVVTCVYGQGPAFYTGFSTKQAAVSALATA
jgi:hypothetical protein